MDRFNFIGGAYSTRANIGSAQRCINYYPEFNPQDAAFPVTLYQRPGLRQLANGAGGWRCLYQASNGKGYGVSGNTVFAISTSWELLPLGTITAGRSNICSMIDNGTTVMLVDGSEHGWEFSIEDGSGFQQIVDGTGTFQGADRLDTLDTYILWNMPGTTDFGSTLSNSITFDPLYFAGKVGYPDLLQTLIVNRRELLLMGRLKSEIWYDAGNANLPFAELPGAYIEHGILAKYSIASSDISVFWLSNDLQGQGIVLRQRGYETRRISNYGIEYAIRKMAEKGSISDAIGYTYQQDGHVFYVLTFPSGDQTWVYDDSVGEPIAAWHQRAWTDADGLLHRERPNCFAVLYGKNVAGDWENGSLYELDPNYYRDQVDSGTGQGLVEGPVTCIRGFPHLLAGTDVKGMFVPSNGRTVHHQAFWLSVEAGTDSTQDSSPLDFAGKIGLRWSDDWGKTFGNAVLQSTGALGEYATLPQWAGAGVARFRLYEIEHSIPAPVALNGAWVMGRIQETNR